MMICVREDMRMWCDRRRADARRKKSSPFAHACQ
jgi:hypothetical protein